LCFSKGFKPDTPFDNAMADALKAQTVELGGEVHECIDFDASAGVTHAVSPPFSQ
jgi:hypothetical protein